MTHLLAPLLIVLALLLPHVSLSLTTPSPPPPASPAQDFLKAHNQARSIVRVPPLKWSRALANAATSMVAYQKAKANCRMADLISSDTTTKYGVNQLWARGTGVVISPKMVVEAWVGEGKYYNYSRDSCVSGHYCGVYKQVVWRKSLDLGCAQATCVKDTSTLTLCFYNPHGNVVGEKPF